jgi:hypothetical protein
MDESGAHHADDPAVSTRRMASCCDMGTMDIEWREPQSIEGPGKAGWCLNFGDQAFDTWVLVRFCPWCGRECA